MAAFAELVAMCRVVIDRLARLIAVATVVLLAGLIETSAQTPSAPVAG